MHSCGSAQCEQRNQPTAIPETHTKKLDRPIIGLGDNKADELKSKRRSEWDRKTRCAGKKKCSDEE